jgi:hypothetical protein
MIQYFQIAYHQMILIMNRTLFLLPVLFWSVSQKVEWLSEGRGTELLEWRTALLLGLLAARPIMMNAAHIQDLLTIPVGAPPDLAAVLPPNAGLPAKRTKTTRTWT